MQGETPVRYDVVTTVVIKFESSGILHCVDLVNSSDVSKGCSASSPGSSSPRCVTLCRYLDPEEVGTAWLHSVSSYVPVYMARHPRPESSKDWLQSMLPITIQIITDLFTYNLQYCYMYINNHIHFVLLNCASIWWPLVKTCWDFYNKIYHFWEILVVFWWLHYWIW